jgi:FixJ family two-component response regulator
VDEVGCVAKCIVLKDNTPDGVVALEWHPQRYRVQPRQPAGMTVQAASAAPKIIAIVDDDAELLKGIERLLNAYGFGTKAFSSAEAFLAANARGGIDCALLDVHLGGMSGIVLRRKLAARGSRLPVIFMTAFDDEATRQQAQAAGCVAYLRKPFPGRLLIEAIALAVAES